VITAANIRRVFIPILLGLTNAIFAERRMVFWFSAKVQDFVLQHITQSA
jgi:hypothetical protein